MFKAVILSAVAFVGLQSQAMDLRTQSAARAIVQAVQPMGLNWTVGDSADYNLSGGIIQGTMHMFVREPSDVGYWMEQDLDLGFLGQQKIEVNINKENGQVVEIIANGQKQTPPDPNDQEIIDSHKDTVTVPKGTFECFWVKVHSKKDNNDSEAWINPTIVPITGMIKTIAPSQMGAITIELTNFARH